MSRFKVGDIVSAYGTSFKIAKVISFDDRVHYSNANEDGLYKDGSRSFIHSFPTICVRENELDQVTLNEEK